VSRREASTGTKGPAVRSLPNQVGERLPLRSAPRRAATAGRLRGSIGLAGLLLAGLAAFTMPAASATAGVALVTGNDISFPQCGGAFPSGQEFGIVGVNDGLPGTENPCFGPASSYMQSELYWAVSASVGSAAQPKASLYVNTSDPGDVFNGSLITDWPSSGNSPYGACTTTTVMTSSGPSTAGANSNACAWVYGQQLAAQDVSWVSAAAAAINGQSPPVAVPPAAGAYPWWLDVETSNTWQQGSSGEAMNVALLQGMAADLTGAGVTSVGVYATTQQWDDITGGTPSGTASLSGLDDWVPGAGTLGGAEANCASGSFTEGTVTLTQWTTAVDNDVVCSTVPSSSTPVPVQIYGTDAIGTSIATSAQEFPAAGSAQAVVLARSDFFSDALAGGPLAAAVGGPLLITPGASISSTLDPRVEAEIQRVLPPGGTVYVLGGDLALSPQIDTTLESLGYRVVREAGADEYATAVDIAQQLGNPSTIFEATGLSFFDALSAVPAAIEDHAAILLTDGSTQAPETAAYLAQHPGDVRDAIGGPLAAAGADPTATAVYGQDLYATSAAVASRFFPDASIFGAATAADFPDALGGGVFMATGGRNGPLLLVNQSAPLPAEITPYLASLGPNAQGYVFGGPLAVGSDVLSALQAAVG
jgi:hypothetical protein